jgi:hypothetical protein
MMIDRIDSIAASQIVSAALVASLVQTLIEQAVLTEEHVTQIYQRAVQTVEMGGRNSSSNNASFKMAREILQSHLQGLDA